MMLPAALLLASANRLACLPVSVQPRYPTLAPCLTVIARAGLTFLFGKAVPKSMKAKLTQAVIAAGGSFDAPYFVSICGEDPGMSELVLTDAS